MMSQWRSLVCMGPLLRPIVLSAGICLAVAGCAAMPDALPESFEPPRVLPNIIGSKTEAEAFKQRVKNDPFPTAGEAAGSQRMTAAPVKQGQPW